MRIRLLILALTATVSIAAALSLEDRASAAQFVNTLAVDVDTTGNTPTSIGPIDRCVELEVGESVDVDVVVDAIPPFDPGDNPDSINDDIGGLVGLGFNILYISSVVNVTTRASFYTTSLLAAEPNSVIASAAGVLPDTDGDFKVSALDSYYPAESGPGTLIRLTLTAVGTGQSSITLSDTGAGDSDGIADLYAADTSVYFIQNIVKGVISVDEACPPPPLPLPEGTSIAGKVTDWNGGPLAGATVRAQIGVCCDMPIHEAISADDGTYVFLNLPLGGYRVSALQDGYFEACYRTPLCFEPLPLLVQVVGGGQALDIDLSLEPHGFVSGHVTDVDGNPIAGAQVFPGTGANEPPFFAVTEADGSYVLGGLRTGAGAFAAVADGFVKQCYRLDNDGFCRGFIAVSVIQGETTSGIDFSLSALPRIEGTITDEYGNPVAGALVGANESTYGCCPRATTTSGSDGRYSVVVTRAADNYLVGAEAQGFLQSCYPGVLFCTFGSVYIQANLDQVVTGIDISLIGPGTITGRVIDNRGEPIADAYVSASSVPCCRFGEYLQARTATDGTYLIGGIIPGTYSVGFFAPGHKQDCFSETDSSCSQHSWITVGSRTNTGGVDMTLNRLSQVSGKVVDHEGNPIPEATVYLLVNGCCVHKENDNRAVTDASGNFLVDHVDAGVYGLVALADGYINRCYPSAANASDGATVAVGWDQRVEGIDIVLPAGSPGLIVTLPSATAVKGGSIQVPFSIEPNFCQGAFQADVTIGYDDSILSADSCTSVGHRGPCWITPGAVHFRAGDFFFHFSGEFGTATFTPRDSVSGGTGTFLRMDSCTWGDSAPCTSTPGTITIIEPHPPHPKDCKAELGFVKFVKCWKEGFLAWWRWKHQQHCAAMPTLPACARRP